MFSDALNLNGVDWPLLQNGAVNLFKNLTYFVDTQTDLKTAGYEVGYVDCHSGIKAFCAQLSDILNWSEQFGYDEWSGNLDALDDAFCTYPFSESGKSVLAFEAFDQIVNEDAYFASGILDVIERSSRNHLLFSRRLIALVQTNDPGYSCENIGGRSANWNPKEWFQADRF
ncbi:hypothetical protein EM6_0147 [Asticcacaulis excentricus]|uniref:Barstar (barnase inhibitor) domain-containing protein n=1 Tax=Asticcacaulis excentricus TaxID=78587 RepID=A0A3G9G5T3_9CAUL|nr:hypothetical protein EM6_0147 [Asticcacaulis excentricus]